jgi:hypothetical protein
MDNHHASVTPVANINQKDSQFKAGQSQEQRIVNALIEHLAKYGFVMESVFDGEEFLPVKGAQNATWIIFNLCECSLQVKRGDGDTHGIRLVPGNGGDIICDWSYSKGDTDSFNQVMDAFSPNDFT